MLTLTLKAASNPDYPGRYLPPANVVRPHSFKEAQAIFEMWRDDNELGGGNMHRDAGKLTFDKIVLGRFSYNGRFWPSADLKVEAIPAVCLPPAPLVVEA